MPSSFKCVDATIVVARIYKCILQIVLRNRINILTLAFSWNSMDDEHTSEIVLIYILYINVVICNVNEKRSIG